MSTFGAAGFHLDRGIADCRLVGALSDKPATYAMGPCKEFVATPFQA